MKAGPVQVDLVQAALVQVAVVEGGSGKEAAGEDGCRTGAGGAAREGAGSGGGLLPAVCGGRSPCLASDETHRDRWPPLCRPAVLSVWPPVCCPAVSPFSRR